MTTLDSGDTVTLLPEPILSPAEQQAATEAEAEVEAGLARRQLERAVDAGIAYRRLVRRRVEGHRVVSHDVVYEVLFLGASAEIKRLGAGTVLVDELLRRLFEHEEVDPACPACAAASAGPAQRPEHYDDREDWARSWSRSQHACRSAGGPPAGCVCARPPAQRTLCVSIKSNSKEAFGFWQMMGLDPLDEAEPREADVVRLMVPFADFCAVAVSFVGQEVAAEWEETLGGRGDEW